MAAIFNQTNYKRECEIMTLVNIILTTATIFISGMVVFFAVGYIGYRTNKKKNYYDT